MAPPESRGAWKLLAFLSALAFLNYMDRCLLFPVLGPIARDLGIAPGRLGTVATGFDVVYACAAPLVGMASDRWPRKRLLAVALVGWTLATGMTGAATGFLSLLVYRSLTGLTEGGYFPTSIAVLGDAFSPRLRSRAIALHAAFATLGGSAGYALGGFAGERWGWRAPFLLALLPGAALAFAFARWFDEPARVVRTAKLERPVLRPGVVLISLAACFASFTMSGMATFLPLYLTESYGVSVTRAGTLTGIAFATTLVGQLSGGVLADRLSARLPAGKSLCVALGYLAVAPTVAMMAHASTALGVLACYAVSQLLRGLVEPSLFATVIDETPPQERGAAQGVLISSCFVGSSAAGAGVGAIIHGHGFGTALHVLAAFSIAAALFGGILAVRHFSQGERESGRFGFN
jgi:predicted MFS family arabinose efflux permease